MKVRSLAVGLALCAGAGALSTFTPAIAQSQISQCSQYCYDLGYERVPGRPDTEWLCIDSGQELHNLCYISQDPDAPAYGGCKDLYCTYADAISDEDGRTFALASYCDGHFSNLTYVPGTPEAVAAAQLQRRELGEVAHAAEIPPLDGRVSKGKD